VTGTVAAILEAHRSGAATPSWTITDTIARIRAHNDPALFISMREEADLRAEAEKLARDGNASLPLYGVPVAVKDNIDVKGLPTTAACPAFSYHPAKDSFAVARLRAAGALIVGKTNLDQFATGLVGVRSPYGIARNALRKDFIPGGSSSGSAPAVAAGLVPLALGTDTAGSGRVPAMLNNIVGLKPSLGLISTSGLVPACRTLDCISVFALTVDDAWTALKVMGSYDAADPYSRKFAMSEPGALPPDLTLGIPSRGARVFFDDRIAAAYDKALELAAGLGIKLVEFDIEPFYETARLLYEGPWVAERYLAIRDLLASQPDAIHPVTKQIIAEGIRPTAADAFSAFYKLEALRRVAQNTFDKVDTLLLPTAPAVYTVDQVLADPILLNSRLGTYTNFVNLLNLCGLAVPTSLSPDKLPFGVTLLAPAGRDAYLASIGQALHAASGLKLGAIELSLPKASPRAAAKSGAIEIAVFGAHLSGLALNHQLVSLGATYVRTLTTAPHYRFYLLPGGPPARPGLIRVEAGKGAAIEAEIWALPPENFGAFAAGIPAPLGIGTVELSDGSSVKGFIAEGYAAQGSRDITASGGWRAFIASEAKSQKVSA
jgi:allophanate hydrolase